MTAVGRVRKSVCIHTLIVKMYNKSNIKQYIFRAKCICDLKEESASGWFSLKQVTVIGLPNFNNECM